MTRRKETLLSKISHRVPECKKVIEIKNNEPQSGDSRER